MKECCEEKDTALCLLPFLHTGTLQGNEILPRENDQFIQHGGYMTVAQKIMTLCPRKYWFRRQNVFFAIFAYGTGIILS